MYFDALNRHLFLDLAISSSCQFSLGYADGYNRNLASNYLLDFPLPPHPLRSRSASCQFSLGLKSQAQLNFLFKLFLQLLADLDRRFFSLFMVIQSQNES